MTLADVLTRRGVRFRMSGDKLHLNCPWCLSRGKPADTKMRCCIHTKYGWGKCLHCDWTRRTAIVAVLRQLGINDAVSGAARHTESPEAERVALPADFMPLDASCDGRERMAWNYITRRGITPELIETYSIGVSWTRPWQYRVMFPVYADGDLKCINARDFTGHGKPKYLLSRGDKWLAYFDPLSTFCVLSEGVIKALRIGQCLIDDECTDEPACSAALLGHDLTDIQITQIIESNCRTVVLWPDMDLVGRRGFIGIADKLKERWHGEVSVVWPLPGPADDVPLRTIRQALTNIVLYTPRSRHRMLLEK